MLFDTPKVLLNTFTIVHLLSILQFHASIFVYFLFFHVFFSDCSYWLYVNFLLICDDSLVHCRNYTETRPSIARVCTLSLLLCPFLIVG